MKISILCTEAAGEGKGKKNKKYKLAVAKLFPMSGSGQIRNIQEYVAVRVIEHMKYRDAEIQQLQKDFDELSRCAADHDIVKCQFCHYYGSYSLTCDFCDKPSCRDCEAVRNIHSWNLAGSWCLMCEECETIYCSQCKATHEVCQQNKLPMCK